jgi:hypothetical protein
VITIAGDPYEAAWRKTSNVNIRVGRVFIAIHTVIPYTGTIPGNIAITGIAIPGRRRVNVGVAAAGIRMTAAMTAGGAIDMRTPAIVIAGGTAIVTSWNREITSFNFLKGEGHEGYDFGCSIRGGCGFGLRMSLAAPPLAQLS